MKRDMRPDRLVLAVLQCALGGPADANVAKVDRLVREAARRGAQVILPPELFEGPYFCREEKADFFEWAHPAGDHPTLRRFRALARELSVAIPVSFFEKAGPAYFNSVAMVDAGGELLGVYRKSHIPDGPGYEEKFYFRPGETGFVPFRAKAAALGVGICWDQWFPECARALVLGGADVLLYPTAIGSEPGNPHLDTKERWRRAMLGHAVCNVVPVAAANRIGSEGGQSFYGSSFIADHAGELLAEMGREEEGVIVATLDLAAARAARASWGFFRDRRPDLYGALTR